MDFVRGYAQSGTSRLHMPGHKGCGPLGCEALDITEIDGADDLFHPEGIIAQSEENAGAIFGAHTLYAAGGSTLCIQAMVQLLAVYARSRGQRPLLLAGRNAHKAFVNAAALLDVPVRWLCSAAGEAYYSGAVTPEQLERELACSREPVTAVYLTCPDYLGELPDVAALAAVCRRAGVLLAVDNAHGAYLRFLEPSCHPLDLGADLCCDSAHKTLPVLTGGAYLHISRAAPASLRESAKTAMAMFGSTSPSYLTLASLDLCNRYLAEGYREKLQWTIGQIGHLRGQLKKQGWTVMMDSDPLKLTIFTGEKGYRGREVAEVLRAHEVECEFADLDAVVLMATPENTERDFQRIEKALERLPQKEKIEPTQMPQILPKQKMRIREAIFGRWEEISCEEAVGRICASPCVSCPPAIPIAASGEEITAELLPFFRAYGIEKIEVVKE